MHLLFDFDGTIADSFTLNLSIFCQITGRSQPPSPAEIERFRQLQTRQILRELDVSLWQIPRLLKEGRAKMRQRIGEVHPFPTIGAVLKKLHGQGHHLYVVSTNSSQNIEVFLKKHGLQEFFTEICGDVGFFGKRRAITSILRRKSIPKQDCLYIGDETRDIKAGNKAGIRTVAVAWGYTHKLALAAAAPLALIEQPTDLLTYVSSKPINRE